MNILDDEFRVSNYIKNNQPKQRIIIDISDTIEKAIQWSVDAMRTIIIPTGDLNDLEDQWINFNSMPKKHRRESDWKCIELFGKTNKELYDELKSNALQQDIENEIEKDFNNPIQDTSIPVTEGYIENIDMEDYYSEDPINYTTEDVEKARTWAKKSNRVIILPTRTLAELESLWDAFNMMYLKHKRESDWTSVEIFGVTNLIHYEYLKKQFLRDDIGLSDIDRYGSVIESATVSGIKKYFRELCESVTSNQLSKSLLELMLPSKGIYEELITGNLITSTIDTFGDISQITPDSDIPYGDLPYYTPDQMEIMGINAEIPTDNFYGVSADNDLINDTVSVAEWFEMYKASYDGFYTEMGSLNSDWVNKVRSLMYGLNKIKESGNENAIRARKQSILELGWNPEIEFTNKARLIARENTIHNINISKTPTRIIDLRGFRVHENANLVLNEDLSATLHDKLYPVFIVLSEGKSLFSNAIKGVTKSIYSHVSISLDSNLDKMYSFGVSSEDQKKGKMRGGFREENIKNNPDGCRVGVYTFFVKKDVFDKIKGMIDTFKQNVKNTSYGYSNIVTFLFNIPRNKDWSLICSQFVDRCLKMAGINITNKDSSLVSPEDINKAAKNEKRIYNVYEGLASKYDGSKIKSLINALSRKAVPLKEHYFRYYKNENTYIVGIINNIDNASALIEMRNHIDVVKNPTTKRLLEEVLFDSLDIKPYCEVKEFPVQFDKEGNLLIKKLKKIDFEGEYSKSHRLLKQYQRSGNIEGIKYELSKLWMMNCLIEEKLNSKKFKDLPSIAIESSSEHKARAKIINDFNYYLSVVMKENPEFNFTEYYDNSPFSSATIKINATTMDHVGKMITRFVKSIV